MKPEEAGKRPVRKACGLRRDLGETCDSRLYFIEQTALGPPGVSAAYLLLIAPPPHFSIMENAGS